MPTADKLLRSPLHEEHIKLNAKMVPFGGWDMPVQYEGILQEHQQTRSASAIFDISHMGEFIVKGDCFKNGLDKIVTMSLEDMPVNTSRYGMMCNDKGGVIDDLIIFRLEEEKWFLVVNAATTAKDAEHIRKNLNNSGEFENVSSQTGKIDIQGPLSRDVLKELVPDIERLEYFKFDFFDFLGEKVLISRTGYTGELGYEIFYPWEKTAELWQKLLADDRVAPAGLGARDILRLEKGYSLYGHELSEKITPLEAGLNRFIDLNKEFIGKAALISQIETEVSCKNVGFVSATRRSPREGQKIYSVTGEEIGLVSSGTFSPCINKGIGLGFVQTDFTAKDTPVLFGGEKQKSEAVISAKIFYKGGSLKD